MAEEDRADGRMAGGMDDEQAPAAGERQSDSPSLSQPAEENSIQQEEQTENFTEGERSTQVVPQLEEQPVEESEHGETAQEPEPEPEEQSQKQPQHEEQSQEQLLPGEQPEEQSSEQPESENKSLNIVPVSEPKNTEGVSTELCWYCMKSLSTEELDITQLENEPPYQRDPRPHFGVAHSSRSTPFPLWDREGPLKRDTEEEEENTGTVSSCPHCHLGLPLDTLRWHEEKCLLFEAPRKDS